MADTPASLPAAVASVPAAKGDAPAKRAPNAPPPGAAERAAARRAALDAISPTGMRADFRARKSGAPTPEAPPPNTATDETGAPKRDPHTGRFLPKAEAAAPESTEQPDPSSAATEEGGTPAKADTAPVTEKPAAKAPVVPPAIAKELANIKAKAADTERVLRQGARAAAEKLVDITDERDHYKDLFERSELAIKGLYMKTPDGRFVQVPGFDKLQLAHEQQRLDMKKLQRQNERRQQQDHSTSVAALEKDLRARGAAIIAKHPELDPKKNPAAVGFWEMRLANPDGGELGPELERDAEAWAMVERGRQLAALKAAQAEAEPAAPPAPVERPASTLPHAQAGSRGGHAPKIDHKHGYKQPSLSAKVIQMEMAARRAQRAGS